MRRPFHTNAAFRLDALLEAKAKQGVQVGDEACQNYSLGSDCLVSNMKWRGILVGWSS